MNKTRNRLQASPGSKQMSFLPEPDFNPKWPRKNTLSARALLLILKRGGITSIDFQNETSSQRLAAYAHDLAKLGWPIKTADVFIEFDNEPNKRLFSLYFLEKKAVEHLQGTSGGARW